MHAPCLLLQNKPSLLLSQTPNTVNTRTNPKKNSIPRPCNGVTSVANCVLPMPWWYNSGKRDFNDAIPAKAPPHCTTMYKMARTKLIRPVTSWDIVTAGLMWPPLTCPIAYLFGQNNKNNIRMRSFQETELYVYVKMANGRQLSFELESKLRIYRIGFWEKKECECVTKAKPLVPNREIKLNHQINCQKERLSC